VLRQGHHDGDDEGQRGELQRRRQPHREVGQHGPAGLHRIAEIAGRDLAQIDEELLEHRAVEAEFPADRLDLLGPGIGAGRVLDCRVARQRADQDERHDQHAEQNRQRGPYPRQDGLGQGAIHGWCGLIMRFGCSL
jgi:hypothetical protein